MTSTIFQGGRVEVVAEGLDDGGKVQPGASLSHQRMTLTQERGVEHEHVASSGTPVLEVTPRQLAWLGRQRRAGVSHPLAARFIQTDEWTAWVNRPGVNFQHVFHASHERGVGFGRDDPLLL